MGWNYLSITKFHRCSLGVDNKFHPTLYRACDYLSTLWLKLIHVSEKGLVRLFAPVTIYMNLWAESGTWLNHMKCALVSLPAPSSSRRHSRNPDEEGNPACLQWRHMWPLWRLKSEFRLLIGRSLKFVTSKKTSKSMLLAVCKWKP